MAPPLSLSPSPVQKKQILSVSQRHSLNVEFYVREHVQDTTLLVRRDGRRVRPVPDDVQVLRDLEFAAGEGVRPRWENDCVVCRVSVTHSPTTTRPEAWSHRQP